VSSLFCTLFQAHLKPTLEEITSLVRSNTGNTIPVYREIAADLLTPVSAYLKLTRLTTHHSFLFESVAGGEKIGRYSLLGAAPRKVVKIGDNEDVKGDPLKFVEKELADVKFVPVPGVHHFTGKLTTAAIYCLPDALVCHPFYRRSRGLHRIRLCQIL
jgi:anthranilate synthase component 1